MIIFNFIAIIAVLSTLFLNVYLICLGRLVFGICGGIFGVALPRMIEETVPHQLLGPFGVITNLSVNTGGLIAIMMGLGLPDDPKDPVMKTTNFWRVIFGLPWVFQAFTIPALLFIVKEDSIKFLLNRGNEDEALRLIKRVYHRDENHEEIMQYLKATSSKPKGGQ
jgi:MFS family permease